MDRDPGILCFKHCKSDIFVFNVPNQCPECSSNLTESTNITPFRIPFPFFRASQYPCSVVLRPTAGDFLRSYKNNAELHIGVTDSKGNVYSFDEHGLKQDETSGWDESLCIKCAFQQESIEAAWDEVLKMSMESGDWIAPKYHEERFNCYTFVLYFLNSLPMCHLYRQASDRRTFSENVLLPLTIPAAKYISLFRQVLENGFYIKSEENVT